MLGINTVLHTKDGRKTGNAIIIGSVDIIGKKNYCWRIKTDYGNVTSMTEGEIEKHFYIAEPDLNYLSGLADTHKHAVDV